MQGFIVDLPNRPGSLADVSEALGAGGVNITATGATTSGSAGTVAFGADDEAGARGVLEANGWPFREVALVVASLEHRPGSLGEAARRLATAGVNLESMFATGMEDGKVQIAFGVSDADAARAALGDLAG
jgi:hypothetical protein